MLHQLIYAVGGFDGATGTVLNYHEMNEAQKKSIKNLFVKNITKNCDL